MNGIGERLNLIRREHKLSLDELSDKIDIPKSSLSRYENYTTDPSIEAVKKIARFFNVSMDWLAGITDIREVNYFKVDYKINDLLIECNKNDISIERLMKFVELLKEEK